MFQLAACPRCRVLQLHRDLEAGGERECRSCQEAVSAGGWEVREEHASFGEARDRLRRLRPRPTGGGFSSGPPVPEAAPPLRAVDAETREALRALLEDLASRDEPVPEPELVGALSDVGAAHLRSHLVREGLLEEVPGGEGGGRRYRVRDGALPPEP